MIARSRLSSSSVTQDTGTLTSTTVLEEPRLEDIPGKQELEGSPLEENSPTEADPSPPKELSISQEESPTEESTPLPQEPEKHEEITPYEGESGSNLTRRKHAHVLDILTNSKNCSNCRQDKPIITGMWIPYGKTSSHLRRWVCQTCYERRS